MHAGVETEEALAGFWAAVSDALLMFPLTPTVRESLLQLLCASGGHGGAPIGGGMRGRSGQQVWPDAKTLVTAAPVMGVLLQLLLGCDDAGQRSATLEALHKLVGGHCKLLEHVFAFADVDLVHQASVLHASSTSGHLFVCRTASYVCEGCSGATDRDCAHAVEGPKGNRAAVAAQQGWEQWLLELLLDGSPCIPSGATQV